ncbi:MAG: hypothetical protein EKK45_15015 [Curvibacter sp.]|nr:MAG: hypothetical protein EKK45_15015 [Curvibacter sp.]
MKPFSLDGLRPVGPLLIGACLTIPTAHADWLLPPGASARLGGGQVNLGCTDVQLGGTLSMGGGRTSAVRNVQVAAGAQLNLDSGSMELAQQWTNQGSVTVTTGSATRVASNGCPVIGTAGLVQLSTPTPVTVPLPSGGSGNARVLVSGPGGCAVDPNSVQINSTGPSLPPNSRAPMGVVRFTATGCSNATLSVQVTYPAGSLSGLSVRKYGPYGTGGSSQMGWFTPTGLTISTGAGGDVVTYTVTDNGNGDNDPTVGVINDPLAPLLISDGTDIPTVPALGPWALLLLSAMLGMSGLLCTMPGRAKRQA